MFKSPTRKWIIVHMDIVTAEQLPPLITEYHRTMYTRPLCIRVKNIRKFLDLSTLSRPDRLTIVCCVGKACVLHPFSTQCQLFTQTRSYLTAFEYK